MGKIVEIGTLGLVKDPFGTEGAQRAAEAGQRSAMGLAREQFEYGKETMAPFMEAGLRGLAGYEEAMAQPFSFDLSKDPLFEARMAEGTKAIERSGAARGGLLGGGTIRSLRDLTSTELAGAYQRQLGQYESNLNRLASLSGLGQTTSGTLAGLGSQFAGTGGQIYQNIGAIGAQAATAPFQNLMTLGQTAGGVMAGIGALSDRRVKRNISKIGHTPSGVPLYSYQYLWDDEVRIGTMAQEVETMIPGSVFEVNGIKAVDYSKVV